MLGFTADVKLNGDAGFHSREADHFVLPIDVPCAEVRDVRLSAADVPQHLVISTPLGILFTGQNLLMLFGGYTALFLESNLRPLPAYNDRSGQPAHIQGEVVEAAQKYVCADRSDIEHADEMLGASFDHWQIADAIERFLFHASNPA